MTMLHTPKTLGHKRPPNHRGTAGDTSAARCVPAPPLYRAGDGGHELGHKQTWIAEQVTRSRRAARPTTCSHCGNPVLVGPDHDTVAMTVTVDTEPVDHLHEITAMLTDRTRHSYDLIRGDLHHRTVWHIHADAHPHPIHLEHRCTEQPERTLF